MTLGHGDVEMKTVTLEVARLKDVKRRARDAFKGRKQGGADQLRNAGAGKTSFPFVWFGKRESHI